MTAHRLFWFGFFVAVLQNIWSPPHPHPPDRGKNLLRADVGMFEEPLKGGTKDASERESGTRFGSAAASCSSFICLQSGAIIDRPTHRPGGTPGWTEPAPGAPVDMEASLRWNARLSLWGKSTKRHLEILLLFFTAEGRLLGINYSNNTQIIIIFTLLILHITYSNFSRIFGMTACPDDGRAHYFTPFDARKHNWTTSSVAAADIFTQNTDREGKNVWKQFVIFFLDI